jgi:hypothetical protein
MTAGAMQLVRRSVPVRTRSGDEMLDDLRARTSEVVPGPVELERDRAGMLLALAGPGALWAADPALALATGADPTPAPVHQFHDTHGGGARWWGGWGGRGAGGACGGGGGFLGGDGSGCGGGGCGGGGGGGGGCGGGGCGGGG